MNNTVRWTIIALLVAVNVGTSITVQDSWYEIAIGVVTGIAAIGLVLDYLVRGRRAR